MRSLRLHSAVLCASLILGAADSARAESAPDSSAVSAGIRAAADSAGLAAPERAAADSARESLGLARRAGHALYSFGSDIVYVATSPTRMTVRSALTATAVLVTAGALYAYDQELYDASRRNDGNDFYRAVIDVGEFFEPVGFMGGTMKYYVGIAAAGYALDAEPMVEIPLQIVESHLIAGGIRNLAKIAFGRRRPFEGYGARQFDPGTGTSLTSGHASVIFEVATILSHHANRAPVTFLCYGAATTVALQRIHSGNHWASDVWLGAAIGTAVARVVVRRHEWRKGIVPTVSIAGGGPRVEFSARF